MAVYFLTADTIPAIKIGHSSNPVKRLAGCMTWSPVRLHLAAADESGDELTEAELLWRFRRDRMHGEWFVATAELRDVIAETARTGAIPGAWHMPEGYRSKTTAHPRGGSVRAIMARYGISLQEMNAITGSAPDAPHILAHESYGLPFRYVPGLFHYLRSCGHGIQIEDLLAQEDRRDWRAMQEAA